MYVGMYVCVMLSTKCLPLDNSLKLFHLVQKIDLYLILKPHFQEEPQTPDTGTTGTENQGDGTETQTETDSGRATSGSGKKEQTSPPETVFKKLAPSYNRYTLLRDEL